MKNITFLNQPPFSEHKVDRARNVKKRALIPKIEEWIASHTLFRGKEVNVSFAQEGKSSLVSFIEAEEVKYVLKIGVSGHVLESESAFLKVWAEDGVSVPEVLEEGTLLELPYILMSFVDAPILSEAYSPEEMVSRKIFVELGSILSKMHTRIVKARGQESSFEGFIEFSAPRLAYIQEHSILNDSEHGSIDKALEIIRRHMAADDRTTYCHNDFAPYNAFATNPITIFDPSPTFGHPYVDLGLAIVLRISEYDSEEVIPQLTLGYFGDKAIDPQVLHAFILFNSHRRIPRWHMTNRPERIARVEAYLREHKHVLDSPTDSRNDILNA